MVNWLWWFSPITTILDGTTPDDLDDNFLLLDGDDFLLLDGDNFDLLG